MLCTYELLRMIEINIPNSVSPTKKPRNFWLNTLCDPGYSVTYFFYLIDNFFFTPRMKEIMRRDLKIRQGMCQNVNIQMNRRTLHNMPNWVQLVNFELGV